MKPIHECAVIKDGNKRSLYLVVESSSCTDSNIMSMPWRMIGATEFESLVASNKVQYLIWENNTIKCKYTNEEVKELMRKGWKSELIKQTQENYWNMDLVFKYRHVEAAMRHQALACSLAGVTKMFGMYMTPICMLGNIASMESMVLELSKIVNNRLDRTFKHNNCNIGQLTLPMVYFDRLLVDATFSKYRLLFDTSTTKFMLKNNCTMPRIPLIQGKANPEKTLKIINRLDRLTLDNEKLLGI